jgi:hypothetical protein
MAVMPAGQWGEGPRCKGVMGEVMGRNVVPDWVEDLGDVAFGLELCFKLVAGAQGQMGQLARIEGQAAEMDANSDEVPKEGTI